MLAAALSSALGNGMIGAYLTCEYFLGMPVKSNNVHFKIVYILNAVIAGGDRAGQDRPHLPEDLTSMMNASFLGFGLVLAYWAAAASWATSATGAAFRCGL